jgi:hypothetical protein
VLPMQNLEATSLSESNCPAIGISVGLIILTCPAALNANKHDRTIKVLNFVMALQVTARLTDGREFENVNSLAVSEFT